MPPTIYIYISEFDQSKGVRERELSTETIKVFSKAHQSYHTQVRPANL